MQITMCGAAGEVTGSAYLVQTRQATVLVDFGLFQGHEASRARNPDIRPIDPRALDAVVVTHAHLDHVGRLPMLPSRGFRGRVHATPATAELGRLVLMDSAHLNRDDSARLNRRRQRAGEEPSPLLYDAADVERLAQLFTPLPYEERREIARGIAVRLFDAGHILGSSSVEMTVEDGGQRRTVVFSGDIGPKGSPILEDPAPPDHADLVFLESTYGDRDHRPLADTVTELHAILSEAARQGTRVLVPAFAIGRSQQILFHIAQFVRHGALPVFPIYLDSPMAIEATGLYTRFRDLLREEAAAEFDGHRLQQDLPGLRFLATAAESRALNDSWDMAVIIAGSGMCDGGRILHHLRHNLWRRNTEVIIVGYQAHGSLGERLVHGAREVRIFGEPVVVRSKIHTLGGFSGHAGQHELLDWAAHLAPSRPRFVLTHGETSPREALRAALHAKLGVEVECPDLGATITLD